MIVNNVSNLQTNSAMRTRRSLRYVHCQLEMDNDMRTFGAMGTIDGHTSLSSHVYSRLVSISKKKKKKETFTTCVRNTWLSNE